MTIKIILISLISFLLIGEIGEGGNTGDAQNSTTYRTLIDGYKGFYRVAIQDTGVTVPFEDHTLYINKGDTVIWINDDVTDSFTITSDEKLWRDDKGKLKSTGKRISYTFNESGTYTFRMNYKKFDPQTIIVNSSDNEEINITNTNSVMVGKNKIKDTPVPNKVADLSNSKVNAPKANNTETYIEETDAVEEINAVEDTNVTEDNQNSGISTNFFEPLNILKIFKRIVMAILAVIIMIFLFKGGEEL